MNRAPAACAPVLLGAALLCAGVGLALQATDALRRLHLTSVDARSTCAGQPAPDDVVIVAVSKTTPQRARRHLAVQRPAPRQLIRRFARAGAKVIAYDLQFSRRATTGRRQLHPGAALPPRREGDATTAVGPGGNTNIFGGARGLEV